MINKPFNQPSGAVFSRDRIYRYTLWRTWDPGGRKVLFVGLNPSTADEASDDPTIRRCRGFAMDWGFGGMLVGNLYGYRATRPAELRAADEPEGPRNRFWLQHLARASNLILACWGNPGFDSPLGVEFRENHAELFCLRINGTGAPAHPLYIPRTQKPQKWRKQQIIPDVL